MIRRGSIAQRSISRQIRGRGWVRSTNWPYGCFNYGPLRTGSSHSSWTVETQASPSLAFILSVTASVTGLILPLNLDFPSSLVRRSRILPTNLPFPHLSVGGVRHFPPGAAWVPPPSRPSNRIIPSNLRAPRIPSGFSSYGHTSSVQPSIHSTPSLPPFFDFFSLRLSASTRCLNTLLLRPESSTIPALRYVSTSISFSAGLKSPSKVHGYCSNFVGGRMIVLGLLHKIPYRKPLANWPFSGCHYASYFGALLPSYAHKS
ncbi:hypothetical protein B0H16DRAFT_1720098 [Mycena metata]|uniref:Uncharacterized protein n=1 Tax=Mycena metata TaxID=1033252 RepID=A0AAD7NGY2_9AGAR|nr:hypothetical protein B0H16DRAFT_1720098 [Mycena metata]